MPTVKIAEFIILMMEAQGENHLSIVEVANPNKRKEETHAQILHDFLLDGLSGEILPALQLDGGNEEEKRLVADALLEQVTLKLRNQAINSEAAAAYVLMGAFEVLGNDGVVPNLIGVPMDLCVRYKPPKKKPGDNTQSKTELLRAYRNE